MSRAKKRDAQFSCDLHETWGCHDYWSDLRSTMNAHIRSQTRQMALQRKNRLPCTPRFREVKDTPNPTTSPQIDGKIFQTKMSRKNQQLPLSIW